MRTGVTKAPCIKMILIGTALTALICSYVVPTTSAAYVDHAFTTSELLTAEVKLPLAVGVAKFRSVDTAGGIGKDGNVYLWGWLNYLRGTKNNSLPAGSQGLTKVANLPNGKMAAVSGQIYDANALDVDGYVWGWGYHAQRNGTRSDLLPTTIPQRLRIGAEAADESKPLLDSVQVIATSEMAGAAIRADGSIYSWGNPLYGGSSGAGAHKVKGLPDPNVAGGKNRPVYLSSGYVNFWTILANGEVWYWGGGSSTPGKDDSSFDQATKSTALSAWFKKNVAPGDPYIVAISGGIGMGQALLSDGQMLTWGTDSSRAGSRAGSATAPAVHPKLKKITDFASGFTGMIALTENGDVWGFGASDDYGQFDMEPQRYATNAVSVSAGQGYYLWRTTDGTTWGMGYNPQGALGMPTGTRFQPTKVSWDLSILD